MVKRWFDEEYKTELKQNKAHRMKGMKRMIEENIKNYNQQRKKLSK